MTKEKDGKDIEELCDSIIKKLDKIQNNLRELEKIQFRKYLCFAGVLFGSIPLLTFETHANIHSPLWQVGTLVLAASGLLMIIKALDHLEEKPKTETRMTKYWPKIAMFLGILAGAIIGGLVIGVI